MASPAIDVRFEDAPLMVAVAHVGFTQSPELFQRITDLKAGLAKVDLVVAETKIQTTVAINPAGGAPQIVNNQFWWFTDLARRRAVGVSPTYIAFHDTIYGGFEEFLGRLRQISQVLTDVAGSGCFLTLMALRYVSGFASGGLPSPYIVSGLHGIPVESLKTEHFHHDLSFWCDTEGGGKLMLKVKTVHGNQLAPPEMQSLGLQFDAKFQLAKEMDAIQIDIHETLQKKTLSRISVVEIEQICSTAHINIKAAFLAATTELAHKKWIPK